MGFLTRAAAAVLAASVAVPAAALETDPFYAWGRDLEDAAPPINAKVNLEIERVLARIDRSPRGATRTCDQVVDAILAHFRLFIFHDVELWATNSPLVDRSPAAPEEIREFRRAFVYRRSHGLDPVVWMPPSPTIEVDGIRIGTDKLTHFFSEGSFYRRWYLDAVEDGLEHDRAVDRAIRRGLWMERTLLGWYASGVLSLGDLEANEQGMRWLVGLCHGESPGLRRAGGGWVLDPPFDLRRLVGPSWDEWWWPNLYAPSRWKKVRPVLQGYCDYVGSDELRERRARYAARERDSVSKAVVLEAVAEGRLPDPEGFRVERVCAGGGEASPAPAGEAAGPSR